MKKFTIVAFLMFLSVIAFAQKPVRFGVYLGEATPLGDLGQGEIKKTTDDPNGELAILKWALASEDGKQGFAGVGFNIGFDMTVALPVEGLGVFGGIDFFYNSYKSDLNKYFDDLAAREKKLDGVSDVKFNKPKIMNIPILFGINYLHNFNNKVGVWGEIGVGPNFRLISKYERKTTYDIVAHQIIDGEDITFIERTQGMDYKSAVTLGFKLGAGVMLWDRMSIGLDFYALGSAPVEGTHIYELGGEDYADKVYANKNFKGKNSMSESELVVRVGYHF